MKQIIGYSVDKETKTIYCSDGTMQSSTPYLDFLLQPYPDSIKVFSDLDKDVSQLLAIFDLSSQQLEKLNETNKLIIAPYSLFYIPGKWFSVDKGFGYGHPFAGFSDMSQYSTTELMTQWPDIFQKALWAKFIGTQVYQAFIELGFNPNNLISPANVYRKEVLDKLDLPKFDDIPNDAMGIAYECCKGNWLEAFAIGHWDKVYDYDINSAYPYQASKLLDLRQGKWKQSKEYQADATYGYCRCEVMIDKDLSPIIKTYGDRNYTPKGVFETSITKAEIDFIEKWQLGYVTIIDGWWWTINVPIRLIDIATQDTLKIYPLASKIYKLYEEKQNSTGMKRDIVKRIMAGSFYGIFIELRQDEFGEHFMSPYAAEIESNTRLQLAETCLINEVMPLHIAVDGIITDKPITVELLKSTDNTMGNTRLEHTGKALICSSGLVTLEGKIGKGDFSVSYDDLKDKIMQNPKASSYQMKKTEVLTLAQAKNLGRIKDVGKTETVNRSIEFGDNKREYEVLPKTFEQLINSKYYSKAWDNEMIEAIEGIEGVEVL